MVEKRIVCVATALALGVAVGGCGGGDDSALGVNELENLTTANAAGSVPPIAPPPMVVRSPSYRCDDGRALYVDVLTDENAVNVRDSRADVPKLLRRDDGEGPFTGEDRSLSGIGDEVRYSGPDRPQQSCRAAPA